jgi:hypothetical protein
MSDETKLPKVGRRDTIKLATAVTALGAGLGVVLDADDAVAGEAVKLRATELGNLVLKFYKLDADGKNGTLLETVDVGALALKLGKGGSYSLKMYNHKLDAPALISEQTVTVDVAKEAPAPPQIKR